MCKAPEIMEEEAEPKKAEVDIYKVIQEKEHDLVLAAELGKVLLDKNEELSRQNERIAEEFSLKLEVRRPKHSPKYRLLSRGFFKQTMDTRHHLRS